MKPVALFAKAICLSNKEQLVIKFTNEPLFSGEIRLSSDVKWLSEAHKKAIKKVLNAISQYVTETYII